MGFISPRFGILLFAVTQVEALVIPATKNETSPNLQIPSTTENGFVAGKLDSWLTGLMHLKKGKSLERLLMLDVLEDEDILFPISIKLMFFMRGNKILI